MMLYICFAVVAVLAVIATWTIITDLRAGPSPPPDVHDVTLRLRPGWREPQRDPPPSLRRSVASSLDQERAND